MRTVLLALTVLLASCPTQSQTIEREIRARYDELERAYEARDIDAIIAVRDPRIEVIGPTGQRDDYARMAEYTKQWFALNQSPILSKFTIQSLDVRSPDEAAVTVLQYASRYQDREGKRRRVEHEVVQRETWVRTSDGWKMRMVDQIDLANRKRWIDGELEKPAPPPQ